MGANNPATDFLDGRVARRTGTITAFGRYADAFADAAFWTWTTRAEDTATRTAVAACWLFPVMGVTVASLAAARWSRHPDHASSVPRRPYNSFSLSAAFGAEGRRAS